MWCVYTLYSKHVNCKANGLKREANGLKREANGLKREANGLKREANPLKRLWKGMFARNPYFCRSDVRITPIFVDPAIAKPLFLSIRRSPSPIFVDPAFAKPLYL